MGCSVRMKKLGGSRWCQSHSAGFWIGLLPCRTSLAPLFPVYVCCEREAAENMGRLNKQGLGLESGCALSWPGGPVQATLPFLSLFCPLSKVHVNSDLEHYAKIRENKV